MISFKINGESKQIPTCWEDLTFNQYLDIFNLKDDSLQLVSIVAGLDYEYLKKAVIINVDKLYEAISFINTAPQFPGSVDICGPYKIPNNSKGAFDIRFESLAQFEDMRQIMRKVPNDIKAHTAAYADYVAIYLQKIRDGEYDNFKAEMMVEEIKTYPAYQVITLGSFFFLMLRNFFSGSTKGSQNTTQAPKKSKLALINSQKRSGRSHRSLKRR